MAVMASAKRSSPPSLRFGREGRTVSWRVGGLTDRELRVVLSARRRIRSFGLSIFHDVENERSA